MNGIRGLPFVAGDPRAAAQLPRRKQRTRYRGVPLAEWRIAAFFARVERARERAVKPAGPYAGNAGEFRRMLEERSR